MTKFLLAALLLFTNIVFAKTVTVSEALDLKDDTKVVLTGTIEKNLGNERYNFKDSTGSIVVEIDDEDMKNLNLAPTDLVEIRGEIEKEFGKIEIDVDVIIKK